MQFSITDNLLWTVEMALQALLLILLIRRQLGGRFPIVMVLIGFMLARCVVVGIIAHIASYSIYYYAYWGSLAFQCLLQLATMIELGRDALSPRWILPRWTAHIFLGSTVAAICVGYLITLNLYIPKDAFYEVNKIVLGYQRAMWGVDFLQCSLFVMLFLFRKPLCLSISDVSLGMVCGFGLVSLVGLLVQTLRLHTTFTYNEVLIQAKAASWLCAYVWWLITLWKARPVTMTDSLLPASKLMQDAEFSLVRTPIRR